MKLTADMADSAQRIKTLVIKAEDARLLDKMRIMRQHYSDLCTLNRSVVVSVCISIKWSMSG